MAKTKSSKANGAAPPVPNKHIHSRLSYLHQAATHLAVARNRRSTPINRIVRDPSTAPAGLPKSKSTDTQNASEASRLLGHLRGVSRKSQIRLAPEMKHSICKRCDSLLVPGRTSTELVVNYSKNGQKPWADVFEIRCVKCGTIKRFPVGITTKEGRGKGRSSSSGAVKQDGDFAQGSISAT
ncbi:hypothetical protein A1O1_07433 [Capronia coronata CBS 617.96]|uniref:Uncharacterized protein n=1 Tax=Capronia coronata CBS 617.96 TaxID=1182541 RepID=W9Y3I8_9EURO|nr:uncharacterized protein A1O1_07433 [Capronia coronata CBS 617.96]EXJ83806.1 hypothetical protein A1O1_07433 [Capronia coronata CBS 617.96]